MISMVESLCVYSAVPCILYVTVYNSRSTCIFNLDTYKANEFVIMLKVLLCHNLFELFDCLIYCNGYWLWLWLLAYIHPENDKKIKM